MMNAKYAMTDIGPILFPANFEHQHFRLYQPTSAGQVLIDGDQVTTFGESITLKMKCDKSDAEKIASAFGMCAQLNKPTN